MTRCLLLLFAVSALLATAPARGQFAEQSAAYPEFHVMGFGDISYISRDNSSRDGFAIGQAVAHLSALLGPRFGVFGEFSATGKDSEYSTEVERLIVKYEFSDHYKLSAGRYHTPIGYWNSAFHHGAWLQTTVARPEMVKFGSQLVPIHFVGVLLEGNLLATDYGLHYKAGYGNGRHSNIARSGDAGDINGDKAWMLQIGAKPKYIQGMDVGIGYYQDEITLPGIANIEERTLSLHAALTREAPEVIIEYLYSEHESVDGSGKGDTDAWYAQFAWRFDGRYKDWKPYARIEQTDVSDDDPLLGLRGLDYDAGILGLRWDFNDYAALKGEYRNEEFADGGREHNFRLQVSFVLTGF